MSGHHIKGKDFLSDKYRILRIDSLEELDKCKMFLENESANYCDGYRKALEDIKKLSEEVSLNKIVLSFKDKLARQTLRFYAQDTLDEELGLDILEVLDNWKE